MKHLLHIAHFSSGNYLPSEFTQFNIVFVLNLPATSHEAYYLLASKLEHRDRLHYPVEQQHRRGCQGFSGLLQYPRLRQPTRSNIPTLFQRQLIKLLQRGLAFCHETRNKNKIRTFTGINVSTQQRIKSDTARYRLYGNFQLATCIKSLQLFDGIV